MKYRIEKNVIDTSILNDLEILADKAKYSLCSNWLGDYETSLYALENMSPFEIPHVFTKLAKVVLPLVETDQQYNNIMLQRHVEGTVVRPHFDPRDVKGYAIVIPFGIYEGGSIIIDGEEVEVNPGDVLLRQATKGFTMGPRHSISAVESGTRYALEFLTIIKEESS